MSEIKNAFRQLAEQSQTAFMPFVTAGDPDLEFTGDLLMALSDAGCHLVELGFPYSDPIADGPVIQASYTRALENGVSVDKIFAMLSRVAPNLKMPVVAMVSYAIIFRVGPESFIRQALECGISGAIVPDMPVDEAMDFDELCRHSDFSLIPLITPTTPDERAIEIANSATGFIYYVSVSGITGERTDLPNELKQRLVWLKENSQAPVCVGFGIGKPDQAKILRPYADGIIVGSAIVRKLATVDSENRQTKIDEISDFASQMIAAIN